MFCIWRTAIAVAVFISAPQLLYNKRKKNYRYGIIEGVVVDDLGRAGELDRGEQRPLSFNYDLQILINQDNLDSNEHITLQISIYQF